MPLFKPSMRNFLKTANKKPGIPLVEQLHGVIYMRFPYLYIGIGKGDHWSSPIISALTRLANKLLPQSDVGKVFADTYHGKVVPIETAKTLVSVQEEISITFSEKVIPYPLARDLILRDPDHIAVLDCPCRVSKKQSCLPLDVCLIIGEPFASMAIEHHPKRSRWITQTEAIQIIEEEEKRGHVHHAFFKQAMIGRFYAICNCCACCCGAMQAHQNGIPMLASSGYISRLDEDLCLGCGVCVEACQFLAITMVNDGITINETQCMGCGICVSHCAQRALSLELEPNKGEPLTIPYPPHQ